jgi:hypothetical protein
MDDWEGMVIYIGPPATEFDPMEPTREEIRGGARMRDAIIVVCIVAMGMAVAHAWHAHSMEEAEVVVTVEALP